MKVQIMRAFIMNDAGASRNLRNGLRLAVAALLLAAGLLVPAAAAAPAERAGTLVDEATAIGDEAAGKRFIERLAGRSDDEALLAKGICSHNLARANPAAWLAAARKSLEPVAPRSAEALAYLGSVRTLEGSQALAKGDVGAAAACVEEGLKMIDDAVRRDPSRVAIRILRLTNGLEVAKTSPYRRYELLAQDVAFLLAAAKDLPPAEQARVWYLAGEHSLATKRLSEALDRFDRATRAAPSSEGAAQARKALAALEE